jgi:hypothetical protein
MSMSDADRTAGDPGMWLRIGDPVRRRKGTYAFRGKVVGEGTTSLGKRLLLVEHRSEAGMCHIYGEADLELDLEREDIKR